MAARSATRSATRTLSVASASRAARPTTALPASSRLTSSASPAARATFLLRFAALAALCPARGVAAAASVGSDSLTMGGAAGAAECPAPGSGDQCNNPLLEVRIGA